MKNEEPTEDQINHVRCRTLYIQWNQNEGLLPYNVHHMDSVCGLKSQYVYS